MDFFEVIKQRFSVREFENKPIEQEKIKTILETAYKAPSAGNLNTSD